LSKLSEEIEQKIREMAKLTILSNRLNEVQEKNLKLFPFVCFDNVKSVRIDYDLSRYRPGENEPDSSFSTISYYLDLDKNEDDPLLKKRFESLERFVRNMFWETTKIEVYFNDNIVYKSKKNA
jgi:hypothetical protein